MRKLLPSSTPRGFTLVEMLVVMALRGVMATAISIG
ncbi:MAG: type II secretion system protein, partial [Candidatus Levyibacteriota bacterium]